MSPLVYGGELWAYLTSWKLKSAFSLNKDSVNPGRLVEDHPTSHNRNFQFFVRSHSEETGLESLGLCGLQFQIAVSHFGKIKEGTQTTSHITPADKSREKMFTSSLAGTSHLSSSSRILSRITCPENGGTHSGPGPPTSFNNQSHSFQAFSD